MTLRTAAIILANFGLSKAGFELECGDVAIVTDYEVLYEWQPLNATDPRFDMVKPCNVTVPAEDKVVLFGQPMDWTQGAIISCWNTWVEGLEISIVRCCPDHSAYLDICTDDQLLPSLCAKACNATTMPDTKILVDRDNGGEEFPTPPDVTRKI